MVELNLNIHNDQYPFQGMVNMDSSIGIPNSELNSGIVLHTPNWHQCFLGRIVKQNFLVSH